MSPEPTDAYDGGFQQPPAEQAYLRAADADRRAAIEIINRGHAEGRLSEPERQERVARAQVAHSQPELNVLTRDLVVIQDSHRADEIELRAGGALAPTTYGSNSIVAALRDPESRGARLRGRGATPQAPPSLPSTAARADRQRIQARTRCWRSASPAPLSNNDVRCFTLVAVHPGTR